MNSLTDQHLLRDYAERRSEVAFAELVRRHVDLVYSGALRMVRDGHLAEDVTQGVFVALAQNARQLANRAVLSGWLHRTAQNLAANTVRSEVRRRSREQEAAAMNQSLATEPDALWEQIALQLDAALGELSEPDRDAVLLRYFERKSAREMAQILGTTEEAAQRRVSRAVERLREFFARRGVAVGSSGLVALIASHAVQAAPAGLAATVSSTAALAGATLATAGTVSAAKAIAMSLFQKALVPAMLAVVAGFGIYQARQGSALRGQVQTLELQQAPLAEQIRQLSRERDSASNQLALLADQNGGRDRNAAELLRLRGEVGRLRQENASLRRYSLAPPSFAQGNTNGSGEGDYTSRDISVPKNAVPYSPGQAAGPPDTHDRRLTTAWTPREAHAGAEWLQLEYAKAVDMEALLVHEAANSGAITKVTAVLPNAAETLLDYAHQNPHAGDRVYSFPFPTSVATAACVRVYFDTTLASGRIAVETVELRGRDGSKQWPIRAWASSYYEAEARPSSQPQPSLPEPPVTPPQPKPSP